MDNELSKLCERVSQISGWEDQSYYNGHSYVPLYTSDYILEKLPLSINAGLSRAVDMFLVIDRPKSLKYQYRAFYTAPSYGKRHEVIAGTPRKALLKLTIALHEAGEL